MTKLISGRVGKIPSANVRADRYQFLELSEAEPDLGLPSQLGQVFTSDLSGNRYWTRLDTANVTENGNLYFTNQRVTANVANLSVGILFDVKLGSNLSTGKALVYDSNVNAFVPVFVNSEIANVADLAVKVISLENQTTANVREASSNLYFTNTRVLDAIAGANSINPLNVNINGNLVIRGSTFGSNIVVNRITSNSWTNLYSSNVIENTNLFFTNARVLVGITTGTVVGNVSLTETITSNTLVTNTAIFGSGFGGSLTGANLVSATFIQGNTWLGLYTANVVETASKLYFTNVRAVDAISLANINPNHVTVNGNLVVIGSAVINDIIGDDYRGNTATFSRADVEQLVVTSNLTVYGSLTTYGANNAVLSDNMIYINHGTNVAANPDIGLVWAFNPEGAEPYQHGGMFRDATDGVIKFFQHYTTEPDSNIFLNLDTTVTGFEFANIQATTFIGNVLGVVSSLSNHTTDALAEGNVNKYYTNARVVQTVTPLLTTGNVVETTNQYFSNVRVLQAVDPKLTTANVIELTNLYFTNARVMANLEQMSVNVFTDVDLTGIAVNGTLVWDGVKFIPGSTDAALRSNFANTAGVANVALIADVANLSLSTAFANISGQVQTLSNFTTANLVEGTNLYFTNTRARTAFTTGKGISITGDGIINNTGAQSQYNLSINGTAGGNVLGTMSTVLAFPTVPTTDRFLLRSLHVVNMSGATAQISGNILYATGNTAPIANLIPVAQGGVLEFIKTYQLFQPGDKINLQGFNSAGTPTANIMTAMLTYETFTADQSFIGIGQTVANVDTNTVIYDSSQSYSVIESVKFINLQSVPVPVRCYWADANGNPIAYLSYGLPIPPNSSVELLQSAKRINQNDKLYASYSNAPNAAVSVFVSARLGATYSIGPYVASAPTGNAISVAFSTTDAEGALLYYTIE
jgi:hypothetical protein